MAVIPASASAGPVTAKAGMNHLAKQDCRRDRREEPNEFANQYGGSGKAALRRCMRDQKREARRDCHEDRREEPNEFANQYGSGKDAMRRCIKDELR